MSDIGTNFGIIKNPKILERTVLLNKNSYNYNFWKNHDFLSLCLVIRSGWLWNLISDLWLAHPLGSFYRLEWITVWFSPLLAFVISAGRKMRRSNWLKSLKAPEVTHREWFNLKNWQNFNPLFCLPHLYI